MTRPPATTLVEPLLLLGTDHGVVFVGDDGAPGGTRGSYRRVSRRPGAEAWTLGEPTGRAEGPGLAQQAVDWMRRNRVLPRRTRDELDRYVAEGIEPGGFLRSVLEDSLHRAFGAADPDSELLIPVLIRVVFQELPAEAWGSRDAVRRWIRSGGRRGAALARADLSR